jgi:hypothetical protein
LAKIELRVSPRIDARIEPESVLGDLFDFPYISPHQNEVLFNLKRCQEVRGIIFAHPESGSNSKS